MEPLTVTQESMMTRAELLAQVRRYTTRCPDERSTADRIAHLIEDRPDCCDRDCLPGHLTGSAWVVSHDGNHHLLLHHKKLDKWLQPGGHADGETELASVALREAQEESGLVCLQLVSNEPIDLDVHDIPARLDREGATIDPAHEHHDFRFLIRATEPCEPVISHESNDVRWLTPQEIFARTQETSVLRLLNKATERLGLASIRTPSR